MMKFLPLMLALFVSLSAASAQRNYNLELLSNVTFPGEDGNDCWGYVDSIGIEYAIMGTTAATYIYSLEDPAAPVRRARIPGARSVWRDIKSYGKFLYVVADQGTDGILVIDMSKAPAVITHEFYRPSITIGNETALLDRVHNLYISKEGLMVLAGANVYGGTPIFFDLKVNPRQPPFVGASRREYAHDVFAERGRLYSSDIYAGVLTIHDYTNPANIQALGSAQTTSVFTHNAWPKADDQFVFTTDEVSSAFVDAFDVSDPTAIRRIDRFRPDESFESTSIPHNTHVNGDYLATSWYRDGLILTDALRPHNLVQVGQYDTYPQGNNTGFDGCWGTYPFLPSGRIIASDINSGLYVFEPTYERGCYFEGTVIDSVTREFLGNVMVDFDGRPAQAATTDGEGDFATGIYEEGAYAVTFSRAGYITKQAVAVMTRGEVNYQIIELAKVKANAFSIRAVTPDGTDIPDPVIEISYLERTGNNNSYDITIGKWGYRTRLLADTSFLEETAVNLVVVLQPGYADEFALDLGWITASTATSGNWERGEPIGTDFNGVPAQLDTDVLTDIGNAAYVTGIAGGSAGDNDVDGGVVTLTSPVFDISNLENATIGFQYHFFNDGGSSTPDDQLVVSLTNGITTLELLRVTATTSDWTPFTSAPIGGKIVFNDKMQVIVTTSDFASSGHLVEAMFDVFEVTTSSQPSIAVSSTFGCAPLTVTYSVAPTVGPATFLLSGASQTSVVGSSATVTYANPGTYSVLLITGQSGMRDTFLYQEVVKVDAAPNAAFSVAPLNLTVSFTSQATNATSLVWTFGDGGSSTDANPVHSYTAAGTYEVTLVARAACGSDTTTQRVTVLSSSVGEFANATGITLLGNPVSAVIQLVYTGNLPTELVLSDVLGRRLLSQKLAGSGNYSLPVANLPNGTYILSSPQAPGQGLQVQVLH